MVAPTDTVQSVRAAAVTDAPLSLRERIDARIGRAAAALPPRAQVRLSGRPPVRLDGQELDAGIQLVLAGLRLRGRETLLGPAGANPTPAEARAAVRREALVFARYRTEVYAVGELEVDGAAGPLRARHYAPRDAAGPQPLLVFVHGGGFAICDLDTHDEPCRLLCRHAGVHVLSIDYRLAPEHPFPAGLEDVRAALSWALEHAGELGADPARVAIGGDSAGGNLSAVAAQLAVREGEAAPALQLLIYPVTDFTQRTASGRLFADGFLLTENDRSWFERHYLGGDDSRRADPRASPLLAEDLSGLPPAIVVTAAFDPLRDEGEAYADALRAAGTPVVAHRAAGMIHGFMNATVVRGARDATLQMAGMLRAALAPRA